MHCGSGEDKKDCLAIWDLMLTFTRRRRHRCTQKNTGHPGGTKLMLAGSMMQSSTVLWHRSGGI